MSAYTITVDPDNHRLIVHGWIPCGHLEAIDKLAKAIGADTVDALVSAKLKASLAIGRRRDLGAWRRELSIAGDVGER